MNKPVKPKPTNIGPALHVAGKRLADSQLKAQVLKVADEVFDRYVAGESFQTIAKSLPFAVQGWKLRQTLMESEETRETYANANILRSHNLVEGALDLAADAAKEGDFKAAIDTRLKVAAKLNAMDYGDRSKVEHTGAGGGPIKLLALTDDQLLAIAAKGMEASK